MFDRRNQKIALPMLLQSRHWGRDLDELQDSIQNHLLEVEVNLLDKQSAVFDGYLAHSETNDLQVSFIQYGAGVRVQCQQDEVYTFVLPYGGECCIRHNKINISEGGRIQLLPPIAELDMTYSGDCGHLVLRFKKTPFHEDLFEPLLDGEFILTHSDIARGLQSICGVFLQSCEFGEHQEHLAAMLRELKQSIYELIYSRSENSWCLPSLGADSRVHLLISFIKDNPDWEYSIGELANLAGWSPRTLYGQFKRQTGTTPYRYYQNHKFFRVRLFLLRYGAELGVTEIATHCGFTHFGRFASEYRRIFGERPNETVLQNQNRVIG